MPNGGSVKKNSPGVQITLFGSVILLNLAVGAKKPAGGENGNVAGGTVVKRKLNCKLSIAQKPLLNYSASRRTKLARKPSNSEKEGEQLCEGASGGLSSPSLTSQLLFMSIKKQNWRKQEHSTLTVGIKQRVKTASPGGRRRSQEGRIRAGKNA